ncbi:MAG: hypothetical protein Q7R56_03585 [Nanoarchaeota archaeon]|nr:hypothetical protein [Nanoarchaeota archaeon]
MIVSKKGVFDKLLLEGAEFLLAAIVCIGLYLFISNLLNTTNDQQVQNNVQGIVNDIRTLVESTTTTITYAPTPLNLGKDFILVGFSKEQPFATELCGKYPETIYKPEDPACFEKTCLCVYTDTAGEQDFGEDTTLKFCKSLPVDNIFTYNYIPNWNVPYDNFRGKSFSADNLPQDYYKPTPQQDKKDLYAEFIINGECYAGPFKTQQLNLELIKYDKKNYLLITPDGTPGYQERQKKLLSMTPTG